MDLSADKQVTDSKYFFWQKINLAHFRAENASKSKGLKNRPFLILG
jgi:hypothetical protein